MRWFVFASIGLLLTAALGIAVVQDTTLGPSEDTTHEVMEDPGPTTVLDQDRRVAFEAEEFFVHTPIPPTTTMLTVQAMWRDDLSDRYDGLALSVRTAASQVPEHAATLSAGEKITIPVTRHDVDRPEQERSAWSFILEPLPDPQLGRSTFNADVRLEVVATGDAERVFSALPAAPSTLLETSGFLATAQHHIETEPLWGGDRGIQMEYVLPDGVRVQGDVRVELTLDGHPDLVGQMRLAYMDADRLTWQRAYPTAIQGNKLVFDIDAEHPDADTIPTGQWRFRLEAPDFVASYEPGLGFGAGYVASSFHLQITQ